MLRLIRLAGCLAAFSVLVLSLPSGCLPVTADDLPVQAVVPGDDDATASTPTPATPVDTSAPTPGETSPPGDDDVDPSLPPGDDDVSPPPGDDDQTTGPGDDDVTAPAGDDDSATPPGDDDSSVPSGDDDVDPGDDDVDPGDDDVDPGDDDATPEGTPSLPDRDGDGQTVPDGDCNDADPTVYSGAPERCDSIDNDCDLVVDEDFPLLPWHADDDTDGYGDPLQVTEACGEPEGYVQDDTDCDDGDPVSYPGALEVCDGADNDCDFVVDEDLLFTLFRDADLDGYGDSSQTITACEQQDGYVQVVGDCDDEDPAAYPGALEQCDDLDNDCDAAIDEELPVGTYYVDADGDGYGNAGGAVSDCALPAGYVTNNADCDDAAGTVNPASSEVACTGVDENCTGLADDHPDVDADGYDRCAPGVSGADLLAIDCNDANNAVYPGAYDAWLDELDANCNGSIDTVTRIVGLEPGDRGDGGQATAGQLYYPFGIALDAQASLYIADRYSHRVRKVTSAGVISTFAGTGVVGSVGDGGPATKATLNDPVAVAADSRNVYIVEQGGARVRQVNSSGTISTLAGTGVAGFSGDGGQATSAQLNGPHSVTVDDVNRVVYVGDRGNFRVRVVDKNGKISTVAGNGTNGFSGDGGQATAAALGGFVGISYTGGLLYIADHTNHRVRRVTFSSGVITTVAGNGVAGYLGDGGAATAASLSYPIDVQLGPGGDLYIADWGNQRIRKVSSGIITTAVGAGFTGVSKDGTAASAAKLFYPSSLVFESDGDLLFGEHYGNRVRRVSAGFLGTVAGSGSPDYSGDGGPATLATFATPTGVALGVDGSFYLAENSNQVVRRVGPTGITSTVAGSSAYGYSVDGGAATAAALASPFSVAVDSAGTVYFADVGSCRIRKVSTSGVIGTVAGNGACGYNGDGIAATNTSLYLPYAVAIDALRNLYITDTFNHRIRKVRATDGVMTTIAGNGTAGYAGDGGAASAGEVNTPIGIAVDAGANVYFAEHGNHVVRRVTAGGVLSTIAGSGVAGYAGDGGAATAAKLSYPVGVAVDPHGDVYVADLGNNLIRWVSGGIIRKLAGPAYSYGGEGGPLSGLSIAQAHGVSVASDGTLYIVDTGNHRLLKAVP